MRFLLYSRATEGGGAVIKSTSAGGGTVTSTSSGGSSTATSSSGGGTSRSTNSGGGTSTTTGMKNWSSGSFVETATPTESNYSLHKHAILRSHFNHDHTMNIPSHSHAFTTPNHTHSVDIPAHTHNVTLSNHTHRIEIPDHSHAVKHEIVELDKLPTRVQIKVDGNTVPHTAIEGDRIDITPFLAKDESGRIKRGRHEVEILPNGLARVEADLIMRVFIQSHLGGVH